MSSQNKINLMAYEKSPQGRHMFWSQRVNKEECHALRSLTESVKMGLVDDILVTDSPHKFNATQNTNHHPLRDINGTKSLMATSVAFHKSASQSIIRPISFKPERTGLAPFGLYPQAGLLNSRRSVDTLEPIRTSLRTYRGIFNKDYMHSHIDISQPDYQRVSIKNINWAEKNSPGINAAIDDAREAQDQVDKGKNSDTHILTPSKGEKLPEEVKSSPLKSKTLLSPLKVKNIVYQPYKLTLSPSSNKKYTFPDLNDPEALQMALKMTKTKYSFWTKKKHN